MQKGGSFLGLGRGGYFSEYGRGSSTQKGQVLQKKHDLKQLLNCIQSAKRCLQAKAAQAGRTGMPLQQLYNSLQKYEQWALKSGAVAQQQLDTLARNKKLAKRMGRVGGARKTRRRKSRKSRKSRRRKNRRRGGGPAGDIQSFLFKMQTLFR